MGAYEQSSRVNIGLFKIAYVIRMKIPQRIAILFFAVGAMSWSAADIAVNLDVVGKRTTFTLISSNVA